MSDKQEIKKICGHCKHYLYGGRRVGECLVWKEDRGYTESCPKFQLKICHS